MATYKGVEITTTPTDGMVEEADRGLEWREEFGRGGTQVGVARARDISNRRELSIETVKRMASYFARHEVDKQAEGFSPGEDGYPSAGRIAWALWGGNPAQTWANAIMDRIDNIDEESRSYEERPYPNEHAARIKEPNEFQGFRRMNDELGDGIDIIIGVKDGSSEIQSIRFDAEKFTAEEARQWLSDNGYEPILFEPASEERAMEDQAPVEVAEPVEVVAEEVAKEDRKAEVEITHRAQDMEARAFDEESRRVRMSISSEFPVERSFGMEVLEHSEEAIDLSFINSGRAPLLLDHDPSKQVGVLESVELDREGRRLRAVARLGRGALAQEAFTDIVDGIKSNISIGYAINKMERKDGETYVAKSWAPLEASLVSLPADRSSDIGVGRSGQVPQVTVTSNAKEGHLMTDQIDVAAIEAQARKAAEKNAAQIVELGRRHNQGALAQEAIAQGRSIEEFRGELLEKIGSQRALENQEIGMSNKEVKRFSVLRAINALAHPGDRAAQEAAAFEFECSQAAAKQYGRTAQGVLLPADVLRNWKRDLNTSDDSNALTEDFRGGDFIDTLRNASSVMQAGARMLQGLSSDVKIPKKATASSATWISSEGGDATASEPTFSQVTLSPKDLAVMTQVTRRMIQQSTLDMEALIREDLAQAIALGLDLAALSGSGTSGQPTGIKNTSGINTVDLGTAPDTTPTFAQIVEMETLVAADNALLGNLAYIMPASIFGSLKTTEKATNTAQFVVEPGGTVNGYRTIVSNQCAAGDVYFGNFSDALIGMWGGLDLLIDPFSNSASGTIRLRAIQTMDFAVRNAVSFCLANDQGD